MYLTETQGVSCRKHCLESMMGHADRKKIDRRQAGRSRVRDFFLIPVLAVFIFIFVLYPPFCSDAGGGKFSVTYLDVGQGDSELISCEGHYMLIDGGTADQSQKIYTVLKNRGISRLDYIVCTHPHADHEGGLPAALSCADCGEALSPVADYDSSVFRRFRAALDQHHVPLKVPNAGDRFTLGTAVFTVLGPTDIEPSMDPNDISLVLRADYGKNFFLFTGDAEQEEQQLMMWNSYDLLNADVLKAAHHGSSNGASSAFITAVSPSVTVISCGKGNSYGHPQKKTLELLKNAKSNLYRTDLQGDVTVTSDGKDLSVSVAKNPDADVWQAGKK